MGGREILSKREGGGEGSVRRDDKVEVGKSEYVGGSFLFAYFYYVRGKVGLRYF